MSFYAVQKGFRPGVYKTWDECEQMVKGFNGAKYKKFGSEVEARDFAFPSEAKGSNLATANGRVAQNKKDIPYKYDSSIKVEEGHFETYCNSSLSAYVLYEMPFKDKNCTGKLFVHESGDISVAIDGIDYEYAYGLSVDEIGYVCIKNDIEEKLGYSLDVLEKAIHVKEKEEYESFVKSMEGSDTVYIYVDGSYNQDTNQYGYGVYMKKENSDFEQIYTGSDTCVEKGRNVEGEVSAATVGLLKAKELGFKDVVVCYDYEGIAKWGLGQWKTNKGYTTRYATFVKNLFEKEGMQIVFHHTKGHTGNKGNEYVDKLAKIACDVPLSSGDRAFVNELQNVPGFPSYESEQEDYEI